MHLFYPAPAGWIKPSVVSVSSVRGNFSRPFTPLTRVHRVHRVFIFTGASRLINIPLWSLCALWEIHSFTPVHSVHSSSQRAQRFFSLRFAQQQIIFILSLWSLCALWEIFFLFSLVPSLCTLCERYILFSPQTSTVIPEFDSLIIISITYFIYN